MRLLLHICCAPCAAGVIPELSRSWEIVGYFYNPNIHPLLEFRRRLKALKVYQEASPIKVIYEEEYGLEEFLKSVEFRKPSRCLGCYRMRLHATAAAAARMDFDAFTSTLMASPEQDIKAVARVGNEIAEKFGLTFLDTDLRFCHQKGIEEAKRRMLYRQKYCGCIFSEYERFKDTPVHIYKGPGPAGGEPPRGK